MITSTHYRTLPEFHEAQLPIRLHEMPVADQSVRNALTWAALAMLLMAPVAIVYGIFVLGQANFSSIPTIIYVAAVAVLLVLLISSLSLKSILARLVRKLGRRRVVTINETLVMVREESLFGSSEWREPLAQYHGVKRTNVHGQRQKLLLSHPDPKRQVAVWIGRRIPDSLVAGYQALLKRSVPSGDER